MNSNSTKFEGFYQGTISSQNAVSPYTLDIVIDESGNYLGTLNNLDVESEIIMRCHYGEEKSMGECVAINIFKSQVFKLYGSATQLKYQGDFEYFEKGIKEFEGDFIFVR